MIEVSHLTKRYGTHTAVSDLSFHIEKGRIYGFLGPNGAGKSTTMNIMTGCLSASEGSVRVGGFDIFEQPHEAKRLIGYLPELPPLYPDRTPREYLKFVACAKGIPAAETAAQLQDVMERTGITDVADRLCKNLSKGYRQRVGIAQALLGNPDVIILDEPTVGLDPRQIIEIRELIRSLGQQHTVILSSHILSEVQAVCDTILIISKGQLVACDTPDNLEKLFAASGAVELTAEADWTRVQTVLGTIADLPEAELLSQEDDRCRLKLQADKGDIDSLCRSLFFAFASAGIPLLRLSAAKASLEDVFLELTDTENVPPQAQKAEPAEETAESEVAEA